MFFYTLSNIFFKLNLGWAFLKSFLTNNFSARFYTNQPLLIINDFYINANFLRQFYQLLYFIFRYHLNLLFNLGYAQKYDVKLFLYVPSMFFFSSFNLGYYLYLYLTKRNIYIEQASYLHWCVLVLVLCFGDMLLLINFGYYFWAYLKLIKLFFLYFKNFFQPISTHVDTVNISTIPHIIWKASNKFSFINPTSTVFFIFFNVYKYF